MIRFIAALPLIAGILASAPANAAVGAKLSSADRDAVTRAEAYLNGMRSLQSQFSQRSSNGAQAKGTLYLRRPGRLRLDYAPPSKTQVYADGTWLIYVDTELREVTQVPLGLTMAGFLVRPKIALSGKVTVTEVEDGPRTLTIHVVQTGEPDSGALALHFNKEPFALRSWTVTDAQGTITYVNLIGPKINAAIGDKVFYFDVSDYDEPIRE